MYATKFLLDIDIIIQTMQEKNGEKKLKHVGWIQVNHDLHTCMVGKAKHLTNQPPSSAIVNQAKKVLGTHSHGSLQWLLFFFC